MRVCAIEGCERKYYCRGYCIAHHARWRNGADMSKPIAIRNPERLCTVDGCENPHNAKGLCAAHYFKGKKPEWREERGGREIERAYHLKKIYGLTLEQYDAMLRRQGGVCAICRKPPVLGEKPLAVDHDHKCCKGSRTPTCGKCVRGLLCMSCNHRLGRFERVLSDVQWTDAAFEYLESTS